jgi:hypothetical protein
MCAQVDGLDVLLTFNGKIGAALSRACSDCVDQEALYLAKAAEIIQLVMFNGMWHSDDVVQFNSDCEEKSEPQALLLSSI